MAISHLLVAILDLCKWAYTIIVMKGVSNESLYLKTLVQFFHELKSWFICRDIAISHLFVAILDLCKLAYFLYQDFSGLLGCWSRDLMKMHCGEIIFVAISFLKNASLPGLKGGEKCSRTI